MTLYQVHLESGPKRRKTMVHVPALLGCIATGATTDAALDATPAAVRAFRRFLTRAGESVSDDDIDVEVVEHITAGKMLGEGSPYISFAFDLAPIDAEEVARAVNRLGRMTDELAEWAERRDPDRQQPGSGRTDDEILSHVIGAQGATLAYALGSAGGYGPIKRAADDGDVPYAVALRQGFDRTAEILGSLTPAQLASVRELPSGSYSVRKAVRHLLEHAWNHLAELSRRPGGPEL